MTKRKYIEKIAAMLFMLLLPFCVASAKIPAVMVGVGGLSPYSAMEYVLGVYGEPAYKTTLGNGEQLFTYGNKVTLYFATEKKLNFVFKGKDEGREDAFLLRRVDVVDYPPMATPQGVAAGMDEEVLTETYGKPDVSVLTVDDKNCDKRLMYVGEPTEENEGICFMTFDLKDGKIVKISCYATRH